MIQYFNKKRFILLILLLLPGLKIFAESEILLRPLSKVILYNNIETGELNPFIYSTKKFYIDESTTLRLIDEYEFSNGFYGDILKVSVVNGFYKNETGFLYEENTALHNASTKKISVFFKDKTYLEDYNILIDKDTEAEIENAMVENGREIVKIILKNPPYRNMVLELKDKNSVHYMINKFSEISYNLRRGKKVMKVVDSETLLPLKNALCSEAKSDEWGILYLDPDAGRNFFRIKKDGYSDGFIPDRPGDKINLALLNPVDHVKYYDDRTTVLEKKFYRFEISKRNLSVKEKIGIGILSRDDLSIFSYPEIRMNEQFLVSGGFYLCNIPPYVDVSVEIKRTEKNILIYHFDPGLERWVKIGDEFTGNLHKLSNLKNGWYLLIQAAGNAANLTAVSCINSRNGNISGIYLRNRKGGFYKVISGEDEPFSLPADEYEFLYFDIEEYGRIIQKKIYPEAKSACLNEIKEDVFKIKTENGSVENQFSPLYQGLWQKRAVKINDAYVNNQETLEYLSDMIIEENGIMKFEKEKAVLQCSYKIIDDKRIFICITGVNEIVNKTDTNELLKIDSSLFNSQLLIPAYYSYQVGILQISFDMIYFTRFTVYSGASELPVIKMESSPFFRPGFPQDEKSAKYKIFFVKSD